MTQEQKDLLLKDLCSRLPYGVKCEVIKYRIDGEMVFIRNGSSALELTVDNVKELVTNNLYTIKPYLLPLSSMTEEQFEELKFFADLTYEGNTLELVGWNDNCKTLEFWLEETPSYCVIKVFDWCNKNHFDYRGLIPMGLAENATDKNIY